MLIFAQELLLKYSPLIVLNVEMTKGYNFIYLVLIIWILINLIDSKSVKRQSTTSKNTNIINYQTKNTIMVLSQSELDRINFRNILNKAKSVAWRGGLSGAVGGAVQVLISLIHHCNRRTQPILINNRS